MQLPAIFSGKKSSIAGRKMIFYGIFAVVAVFAFLLMVWVIPTSSSNIGDTPVGLEEYLALQRFLNSPLCFALQDKEINKAYPRIIDLKKFGNARLDTCYNQAYTKSKAYRLMLTYNSKDIAVNTKNWEGFAENSKVMYVYVYDEGNIQRSKLLVEIQHAE